MDRAPCADEAFDVGKTPDVSICPPPSAWQTDEIDFTAARYDAAGKKTPEVRITVRHNGVLVDDDMPFVA